VLWILRWPTRSESVVFAVAATASIAMGAGPNRPHHRLAVLHGVRHHFRLHRDVSHRAADEHYCCRHRRGPDHPCGGAGEHRRCRARRMRVPGWCSW
jgi:hypothetical protein